MAGYYLVTHPKTKHEKIFPYNLEGLKMLKPIANKLCKNLTLIKSQ